MPDHLKRLFDELTAKYKGVKEPYEDGTERQHYYKVELQCDRVDVITCDDGGCEVGRESHR
ncbi:hypothetical protein [Gimesia maris]|uniref:Uncharacterized protein n=1 Tax=Gimesia maris TaxID=122 RepID=A0ABX5YVQ2_9PLAN|nr:hypothetical protein [Gimesia maris]EDL60561.1 hypothetical protein PM8797T_10934 [Gimesia maris DSM 8797]QEG19924.1 hypothetical protein GmarT_58330 [Gimesia maris]QGQ27273.1 hypothetical protein F1729_00600 [Gimesia maris]